jgi:hypothetical protein
VTQNRIDFRAEVLALADDAVRYDDGTAMMLSKSATANRRASSRSSKKLTGPVKAEQFARLSEGQHPYNPQRSFCCPLVSR